MATTIGLLFVTNILPRSEHPNRHTKTVDCPCVPWVRTYDGYQIIRHAKMGADHA